MLIKILTFVLIYIFNIFFIKYHSQLLSLKLRKNIVVGVFPVVMSLFSIILITNKIFLPITYIITYCIYLVLFKMIFSEDIQTIAIICMYNIFQLIVTRDIIIGLFTIFLKISMYKIVESDTLYLASFALCRVVMIIQVFNLEKPLSIKMIKLLLINKKNLKMMNLMIFSLVVILLDSNYTYYYSTDDHVTTYIMITNRICINFCFYFALNMGVRSIKWVEDEVMHRALELQIRYHKKIQTSKNEFSKLIKMYNHDFKSIINNVSNAVNIKKVENANKLIESFDSQIKKVIENNKEFSNNQLVNAMLNRLGEKSKLKNIKFTGECYIPTEISITEVDLVRIFNNLCSNAYEACIKQEENERKCINFKSYVKDNNLIIYQNNSFSGEIKMVNDKLITTKDNSNQHGIGVESIKYIVNEADGVTLVNVDKEAKEFKFLIKIPMLKENNF